MCKEIRVPIDPIYASLLEENVFNNEFINTIKSDLAAVGTNSIELRIELWILELIEFVISDAMNIQLLGALGVKRNGHEIYLSKKLCSLKPFADIGMFKDETIYSYIDDRDFFNGYRKIATTRTTMSSAPAKVVTVGEPTIRNALDEMMHSIVHSDAIYNVTYSVYRAHSAYMLWVVHKTGHPKSVLVEPLGDFRILQWNKDYMKGGKYVGDYFY